MQDTAVHHPPPDFVRPPTQDELLCDDGMPMDDHRNVLQMNLLIEPLNLAWADRPDGFVGGNMFVYFRPNQVLTDDFRGPDVFVALGVPKRERKSWVVWEEGKGPDVVIELLSHSTRSVDRGAKREIYRDRLRVPEYFWFDIETGERAGFILRDGRYGPLVPDEHDRLPSPILELTLVHWHGVYQREERRWLRWAAPDGVVLPTAEEAATQARAEADAARARIAELEARLARFEGLAWYEERPPDTSG